MDHIAKINIVQAMSAIIIPNLGELLLHVGYKQYYNNKDMIITPNWTIPDNALTIAWVGVYGLIGYSSFLIIKYGHTEHKLHRITRIALILYGSTVAVSWTWRIVLFVTKNIILAWVLMIILDILAITSCVVFFLIKPTVSSLFLPYIVWLMVNTVFNFSLIGLNKR